MQNESMSWRSPRHRRKGLTLLELVVVMADPGGHRRNPGAAVAQPAVQRQQRDGPVNVTELNKAVQTYQAINYQYPDGYDSLTLAGTTGGGPQTSSHRRS